MKTRQALVDQSKHFVCDGREPMTKSEAFHREQELQTLRLLFEKLAKRIQPKRYCEMKVVIQDGQVTDSWIMDKGKTREQIEAF